MEFNLINYINFTNNNHSICKYYGYYSLRGEIVFKCRDFYLMKVYNSQNKYIGVIEDITVDFHKGYVEGFTISPASIFKKRIFASIASIISIDEKMKIRETSEIRGTKFKEIKYIEVVNSKSVLLGVLEDLIIEKESFKIKGLIISSGIFDKMFKGKEIITLKHCTMCNNYISYNGTESVRLKTLPHSLGGIRDVKKI